MSGDVLLFAVMILCGAALSIVFDFFRAIRRSFRLGSVLVAVSDVIYCIIACLTAAGCVWNIGGGEFRFYEVLGLVLGGVFYFLLLSKWILRFFLILTEFILKILLTPPQFLYKILVVPVHKYRLNIRQRSRSTHDKRIQKQSD